MTNMESYSNVVYSSRGIFSSGSRKSSSKSNPADSPSLEGKSNEFSFSDMVERNSYLIPNRVDELLVLLNDKELFRSYDKAKTMNALVEVQLSASKSYELKSKLGIAGGCELVIKIFETYFDDPDIACEGLKSISIMCSNDNDNKYIVGSSQFPALLIHCIKKHKSNYTVLEVSLKTILDLANYKSAVRSDLLNASLDDIAQMERNVYKLNQVIDETKHKVLKYSFQCNKEKFATAGINSLLLDILSEYDTHSNDPNYQNLLITTIRVIASLCGNDVVCRDLVVKGTAELIADIVKKIEKINNLVILQLFDICLWTIIIMCADKSHGCKERFIEVDVHKKIFLIMHTISKDLEEFLSEWNELKQSMLEKCCWTLHNIVLHCPGNVIAFKELSIGRKVVLWYCHQEMLNPSVMTRAKQLKSIMNW